MKTEFRHLEFNVTNLNSVKAFYEDIFKYFEYVIAEETPDRIKFISNGSDFTFININEDHPHFQEFLGLKEINFWVYSKNDVDLFYKEFLLSHNIQTIDNSPKYYEKNYYGVKFVDPEGFTWEIFHNPNGDTKSITQELRKNFIKEFIYSVLLFPFGIFYAYKLYFIYNHKLAGIVCLIITFIVFMLYLISIISITSSISEVLKDVNQYSNINSLI